MKLLKYLKNKILSNQQVEMTTHKSSTELAPTEPTKKEPTKKDQASHKSDASDLTPEQQRLQEWIMTAPNDVYNQVINSGLSLYKTQNETSSRTSTKKTQSIVK